MKTRLTHRRLARTLAFVLVLLAGLCSWPGTARADMAPDSVVLVRTSANYGKNLYAMSCSEVGRVWCVSPGLPTPETGTRMTRKGRANNLVLDWVVYHGVWGDAELDSAGYSYGSDAQFTAFVQTVVEGAAGGGVDTINGFAVPGSPIAEAAIRLYHKAKAWADAGGIGPERGCAVIYLGPSGVQNVVARRPAGAIRVKKTSSAPGISEGNACYSLAGATYRVFADEPCTQRVTDVVTDASGAGSAEGLSPATYWVREVSAPAGFALDSATYRVVVLSGGTTSVSGGALSDAPLAAALRLTVSKRDLEGTPQAQGDATLTGACFELRYYDDSYASEGELPEVAARSWRLTTAELDGGVVGAVLGDERCALDGDEPYRLGEEVALPLGTVTVREVEAPEGYLISDGSARLLQVVADPASPGGARVLELGEGGSFKQVDARGIAFGDQVIRGGVRLGKIDAECKEHRALGGATLAGAVMAIEVASEAPVLVDGRLCAKGQVVTTVTLDEDGMGATAADALPYGSYVAWEAQAPEGYLLTRRDAWTKEFSIREDGVVVDLSGKGDSVADQVRRGDLDLTKVAEGSMERLGGVAFVIESRTTGEAHVVVTDANGYASTASSWNAHTSSTNACDAAVERGGDGGWVLVDAEALDAGAGVWFSGATDLTTTADDGLGALPYDEYLVSEIECPSNEGRTTVSFDVSVYRHQAVVGAGTVIDAPGPSVRTTLTDIATGAHVTQAASDVTLCDLVVCRNLEVGASYDLEGTLHLVDAGGTDLGELTREDGSVVRATMSFLATASDCAQTVSFEVDASRLAGCSLVAFETLRRDGEVVAEHADIADEGQTVGISLLATTLLQDGGKEVAAVGRTTVVDTVSYQGLRPGVAYTVRGVLMDRETGEAADGGTGPISGATVFTPSEPEGTVDVSFVFDGASQAGRELVAFETLEQGEAAVAVHADLDNAAQTVRLPAIRTVAVDAMTRTHEAKATEDLRITDSVTYSNLEAGAGYELVATLVDAATGKAVTGSEGTATGRVEFAAAEGGTGTQEVELSLDASELGGRSVVVFEALYRQGRLVAEHADTTDADQTVRIAPMPASDLRLPRTADEAADIAPLALAGLSVAVLGALLLTISRGTRGAHARRPRYTLPPRKQ